MNERIQELEREIIHLKQKTLAVQNQLVKEDRSIDFAMLDCYMGYRKHLIALYTKNLNQPENNNEDILFGK